MKPARTRFPKKHLWRSVDQIVELAVELDPGDPDGYDELLMTPHKYRYLENRHCDLEAIYYAALALRDAIGSFR